MIQITDYHSHCDKNGCKYYFTLGFYLRLLDNGDNDTKLYLSNSKCLLSTKQFELYNYLIKGRTAPKGALAQCLPSECVIGAKQ